MIRRFNYTDRQKIPRQNIRLAWIDDGNGTLRFSCDLNLELERLLDPAGRIFVEAYSGPVIMRFPFGTVEHPEHPADTSLADFPPGLKPLFRIKVVDPAEEKRLLAVADAVTPLAPDEIDSGRRSILPVETVALGHRVWNLRIESNTFFLQLNSSIRKPRDINLIATDPDFVALVYPAVIRQILEHLLLGPEKVSVGENHEWLIFASQLANRAAPTRNEDEEDDGSFDDEVEAWINEAIDGFCLRQNAAETFVQFKMEVEEHNV